MTHLYILVLNCLALKSAQDKQSFFFFFCGKFIRQKALLAETFHQFSELFNFFGAD